MMNGLLPDRPPIGFTVPASDLYYLWDGVRWILVGSLPIIAGASISEGSSFVLVELATTGIEAGTYRSVTVDECGRVIGGTSPTTLTEYGIIDAQSALISGQNIRTVFGSSVLGAGNIRSQPSATGMSWNESTDAYTYIDCPDTDFGLTWNESTDTYATIIHY